jgi:nucleoside 2-deoxyribosyltransferase
MKIYLAHNFKARWWLRDYIKLLELKGHQVTSTWITDDAHIDSKNKEESALVDLEDIDRADCLILFTDQYGERPGKGKFLEMGYALGKGKQVYIHGQDVQSSVFYHLPQVIVLDQIGNL